MARKRWRITNRDLGILAFLARYGAATAEQVMREFFPGAGQGAEGPEVVTAADRGEAEGRPRVGGPLKAANRRLKALKDRGAVDGERIFYSMPQVYRVTEVGARLAEADLPAPGDDYTKLNHTLEVLELSWAIRSEEAEPGEGVEAWITEREIRRDKLSERREKETGRMRQGAKMGRTPDGLLLLESGERVAVELELTPKRPVRYKDILADYERQMRAEQVDGLRFYSASRKNMARVRDLCKKHRLLHSRAEFLLYEPVLGRRR